MILSRFRAVFAASLAALFVLGGVSALAFATPLAASQTSITESAHFAFTNGVVAKAGVSSSRSGIQQRRTPSVFTCPRPVAAEVPAVSFLPKFSSSKFSDELLSSDVRYRGPPALHLA